MQVQVYCLQCYLTCSSDGILHTSVMVKLRTVTEEKYMQNVIYIALYNKNASKKALNMLIVVDYYRIP